MHVTLRTRNKENDLPNWNNMPSCTYYAMYLVYSALLFVLINVDATNKKCATNRPDQSATENRPSCTPSHSQYAYKYSQ